MAAEERLRPRAFRLDDPRLADPRLADAPHPVLAIELTPDPFVEVAAPDPGQDLGEAAVEIAQKRSILRRSLISWAGLFWSALGGLVSLAASLWITRFIEDLFARSAALGAAGLVLAVLAALALIAMGTRECVGIARQRAIAELHIGLANARAEDDRDAARRLLAELCGLYAKRPQTAQARAHIRDLTAQIIDGRDLIDIAERRLVQPLDREVRREIATAAKRVSIVTAVAPRAIVDVIFVGAQAVRLLRRIAEIYGGRPGLLGFLKLARSVGAHLAMTGGMAIGDSLIQQVVGHGIAAKISARLGEGVLNGLLTARVGMSAMAVCRPMPFAADPAPSLKDVVPFLFTKDREQRP